VFVAGSLYAGEFKPDKNTLFLAHYNTGIVPDSAKGTNGVNGFASITSNKGGYFGEALVAKDGMCTNPEGIEMSYKAPLYKAQGNYSSAQGTMEIWVKLGDSWEDILARKESADSAYKDLVYFCEWRSGQEFNWGSITLIYNKWEAPLTKRISFMESTRVLKDDKFVPADGKEWGQVYASRFHLDADASTWKKDEWHHIAATWDAAKNERALFVDGVKVASGESKFANKAFVPQAADFMVGGLSYRPQSIPCVIDEVRISDITRYSDNFKPEQK
jgi:hypothetical protein